MYMCAQCGVRACKKGEKEHWPKTCPMHEQELMQRAYVEYEKPENHSFYVTSSELEALGYGVWPRVRETMELCRRMNYTKLGLAFCGGLHSEAKTLDTILRKNGFEVVSVMCKTGGIPKQKVGIPEEHTLHPERFEAMCNPIAQAMLLEKQQTQFNIVLGLCVGHDSLFYKYSHTLTTTVVVKDRVLAHNPVGALYCASGYLSNKIHLPEKSE
ncbi:DUF1847 domain-containing protein [uncultured Ruthenibacterium sp.]|uniref:DUF1847 domain-containing protein n=1 Tax=uncultured Ruthenibacterium sp. TaxID=1905347 RepID=UPI00349EFD11